MKICFPILFAAVILTTHSCQTVKPYQRTYLNDREMKQGKKNIEEFEDNVHVYREGAAGGGSKAGGGCGCN